jgi:hypothetical protein
MLQCQKDVSGLESSDAQEKEFEAKFFKDRPWFYLNLDELAKLIPEAERADWWLKFPQKAFDAQQEAYDKALVVARKCTSCVQTRFGKVHFLVFNGSDGDHKDCEMEIDAAGRNTQVHAGLVLLRDSQGNTMVSVNRITDLHLAGFIRRLRVKEAESRGVTIPRELQSQEGTLKDFPHWHVAKGIGLRKVSNAMSFNEPTNLSFEEIHALILEWLEVDKCTAQAEEGERGVQVSGAFEEAETKA